MSSSTPQTTDIDPHSQTFTLADGRKLGYSVYGHAPSPAIPNIIYFHGFPTSRLEAYFLASTPIPLHIIAIDRPGLGLSTFQPSRRIIDWPTDVLALLSHLQIATFHIVAASGGSPYALVCARDISASRVLSTTVVSGIYPLSLGTEGMQFPLKMMLYGGAYLPRFFLREVLQIFMCAWILVWVVNVLDHVIVFCGVGCSTADTAAPISFHAH